MKTRSWLVLAAIVTALLAALAVAPWRAAASPPETGSGTYVVTGADITDVRVGDDGTVFIT